MKKVKAFTLIELLIVIAIIAILTVAFLPTLRGGQIGARNAARKAAVNDIVLAIERIVNGDLPAGVTLTAPDAVGLIPVSPGACLDWTKAIGLDIRAVLGRTPSAQLTNLTLCTVSGNKSGYFYASYGAGAAIGVSPATNYAVITEVEPPVSNGNVSGTVLNDGAAKKTDEPGAGIIAAGNALFDNWTNALKSTSLTSTNTLWAATK